MQISKRQRIDWIDVVKGIAIILMIVGHTKCPKTLNHIIFSFHMPLFFVLSGLTFTPAKDWKSLLRKTWRSFCGLLLPITLVMMMQLAYNMIVAKTITVSAYMAALADMFKTRLYWASGVSKDGVSVLGVFWFVFSLFWGKLIINLFSVLFGKKSIPYLCTATALWAVYLGKGIYMPQNMDVTLVAVLFIAAGITAVEYRDWISRYKLPLFAVSIAWCLHHLFWSYKHYWAASSVLLMQIKRVALNTLLTSAIVLVIYGVRWLCRKLFHKKAEASS